MTKSHFLSTTKIQNISLSFALIGLSSLVTPAMALYAADFSVTQAKAYEASGQYDEAVKTYFYALENEPANLAIQDALVNAAEEALNKSPDSYESRMNLGNAYACRNDFVSAQREFSFAIKDTKEQRKKDIAMASLSAAQLMQFNPAKSRSAAAWLGKLKVINTEILACPYCKATNVLIPAISAPPTPEQATAVSEGRLYLALNQKEPSKEPEWYCANCHRLFESSAQPAASIEPPDFKPYIDDLQRRIKRAWFPPRGNHDVKVVVTFKVHRGGELSDLRILISSGVAVADNAALKAVENAAPFRPMPTGVFGSTGFEATCDYRALNGDRDLRVRQSAP